MATVNANSEVTVLAIVKDALKRGGFDGLFNPLLDCACELSDLEPCGSMGSNCSAGYRAPCDCGDHDCHIQQEKPECGGEDDDSS